MERQVQIGTTIDYRTFTVLMDAIDYEIADIEQEMETMEGYLLEQWRQELGRLRAARDSLLEGSEEVES